MSWPTNSNFNSSQLDDAWWNVTLADGTTNVCATTESSFVGILRTSFGLDETLVWDDALTNALAGFAAARNTEFPGQGWDSIHDQILQDITDQAVAPISVGVGLYAAYYYPHGERFDAINFPPNAILPVYGAPILPYNGSGSGLSDAIVCFNTQTDPNPTVQDPADRSNAQAQSTYGVRLAAGQAPPAPMMSPAGPAGLGWFELIAIGAAFAGIVYVLTREPSRPAQRSADGLQVIRNPRHKRARRNSSRTIRAIDLHAGDTIEMEDLGRQHVIQGPYRSGRGIRFVGVYGDSFILHPHEMVTLVARES
jgi:hypothetical protein